MTQLVLENLSKTYSGNIKALQNFSLKIESGELTVVVGPSGCGKTTLLRILAGLETLDSGNITLDEQPIHHLPPQQRNCSLMFQHYTLFPHMTIYKNMAFGLKQQKIDPNEIENRVKLMASQLGISDLLDRFPSQLSGGQKQRAALGRAIVRKPDLILLDEPLSNLDARLRTQMRSEIHQVQKDLGNHMIYVTHDQVEAMTLGNKIVVLNQGLIQQIGAPSEVYHEPSNCFVADFIGSPGMNLISGQVKKENSKWIFNTENLELDISKHSASPHLLKEGPLILGIRPENIELHSKKFSDLDVTLLNVEHLGSQSLLYSEINNKTLIVRDEKMKFYKIGDELSLNFPLDHIHLFNESDGNRIQA